MGEGMQYDLLHLSVLRRSAGPLLDLLEDGEIPTREAWLRSVLGRPIAFIHRGGRFHYAAQGGVDDVVIVGRIGRPITATENAPPEENLNEVTHSAWKAALALVDPRHHDDGQKVAMESIGAVGRPLALFESLAAQINSSDPPEPYVLEVSNIAEEATFWNFVSENQGQIVDASFELIAPNMFGQEDDFDNEMKAMADEEKIKKVKFELENDEGLNLDTKRVRATARYATRGGGIIKAKTKTGKRFNSSQKGKKVPVPAAPRLKKGEQRESVLHLIKRSISTIFGS